MKGASWKDALFLCPAFKLAQLLQFPVFEFNRNFLLLKNIV